MDWRRRVPLVGLLLWIVILLNVADLAFSVADKCAACRAVAEKIESGLANERPHNHLDLRHRLDSKGQREGKVIDYKVSELRVVELLEGLCEKFKSHTLKQGPIGDAYWEYVDKNKLSSIEKQEAETYSKELVSYCGILMEATDDELTRKIQKGLVKTGDVQPVLCVELSQQCKPSKTDDSSLEDNVNIDITGGSDGDL